MRRKSFDYNSLHVGSKVNILSEILCHRNQGRNFSLKLRSSLMSTSVLTKYTLGLFECAYDCVASHHFLKMTKWSIFWCKWERYLGSQNWSNVFFFEKIEKMMKIFFFIFVCIMFCLLDYVPQTCDNNRKSLFTSLNSQ